MTGPLIGTHTYVREINGVPTEVTRAPIDHHAPVIARLAAAGHNDTETGALLGLTAEQVRGVRRRQRPPIPAAVPRGRPRRSLP